MLDTVSRSALGDGHAPAGSTLDDDSVDAGPGTSRLRLQPGTALDRYLVLSELGAGGMGVVYAAYDPELDRKIALKLLHPETASERAAGRLMREAQAIARVTHPNVVTVHDVGTYDGRVFIAMEFVEGVTLARWVEQAPRRWQDIRDVLCGAGRGLVAAHAAGLVHRDFKPDNILVDGRGRAVVLDFGLARRAGPAPPDEDGRPKSPTDRVEGIGIQSSDALRMQLTRTGAKLGTPAYMAPEQHLSTTTDGRTDQFAFCTVLWEALYGTRPFLGQRPTELATRVVRGEIAAPPRDADVPTWVRRTLERGLAPNPEDRFPSMEALLTALTRDPGRRRRRWMLTVGGTIAVAASWGVSSSREAPCDPTQAAARWNETWNETRARTVAEAFGRSALPYAAAASGAVDEALRAYGTRWAEIYTEACRATHLLHEQSAEARDLQMSCLRGRRAEVGSLIEEFVTADASVVQRAVEAVSSLANPAGLAACEDIAALAGGAGPPPEPVRREVQGLRRQLAHVTAKEKAGRYDEALALLSEVQAAAARVGHPPVRAEVALRWAALLESRGDYPAAEQALLDAIWLADAVAHDRIAAQAWVRLVWVSGVEQMQPERGHLWSKFAEASIARIGGDALLQATLTHNLGGVYYREGRYAEGLEHYRRALEAQIALLGADDPVVAMTLNHIGNVLMEQGEYEAARTSCERSLEIRRVRLGARHPKVAASLNNLGELARKRGEHAESLEHAVASLAIVGGSGGPEEEVALVLASDALGRLERWRERAPLDERLLEVRTRNRPPEDPSVARARARLETSAAHR